MPRISRSAVSAALVCSALVSGNGVLHIKSVNAQHDDTTVPSALKVEATTTDHGSNDGEWNMPLRIPAVRLGFVEDSVKKIIGRPESLTSSEALKAIEDLHMQLAADIDKILGVQGPTSYPAAKSGISRTEDAVLALLTDAVKQVADPNVSASLFSLFGIDNVFMDLQRFLDFFLNWGLGVDVDKTLSGTWVKDFQQSVDKVLSAAEKVEKSEDKIAMQLGLIDFANEARALSSEALYTPFLKLFDEKWMQSTLSRFGDFSSELERLIDTGRLDEAATHFENSAKVIQGLKVFQAYANKKAAEDLPGALVKSVKDYGVLLRQLSNSEKSKATFPPHFEVHSAGTTENTSSMSDNPDGKETGLLNLPSSPALSSGIMLVEMKSYVSNIFRAFENYVLGTVASSVKALQADLEEASSYIPEIYSAPTSWTAAGGGSNFAVQLIETEIDHLDKLKGFLVEISGVCAGSKQEDKKFILCRSISEAIGSDVGKMEELPRNLQQYFDVDPSQNVQSPIDQLPIALLPRISATIARVPQLFPVISSAASSTVNAFVDSSQIVAGSMLNVAGDVRDRLMQTSELYRRQHPVPTIP